MENVLKGRNQESMGTFVWMCAGRGASVQIQNTSLVCVKWQKCAGPQGAVDPVPEWRLALEHGSVLYYTRLCVGRRIRTRYLRAFDEALPASSCRV